MLPGTLKAGAFSRINSRASHDGPRAPRLHPPQHGPRRVNETPERERSHHVAAVRRAKPRGRGDDQRRDGSQPNLRGSSRVERVARRTQSRASAEGWRSRSGGAKGWDAARAAKGGCRIGRRRPRALPGKRRGDQSVVRIRGAQRRQLTLHLAAQRRVRAPVGPRGVFRRATPSRGSVFRLVVVVIVVIVVVRVREAFIRVAAPADAVDPHRVPARVLASANRSAGRELFQQRGRHGGETHRHSPPSLAVRSYESGE